MTFVNEYISAEDIERYDVKRLDERFRIAHYRPTWTVDKGANVYLRYVRYGREEASQELDLLYFWKGELLYVRVSTRGGGQRGGHGWRAYSNLRLGSPDEIHRIKGVQLPERLHATRNEILAKLKEALHEYKDLGVLSSLTSIETTFDF